MTDWNGIRYFTAGDAWGDPAMMDRGLIERLDEFRHQTGTPFYVTFGTQGKHVAPWHGMGLAVDGVLEAKGRSKLDLILTALRFSFSGVGVYPMARHPKCSDPLGFHFDMRPAKELPGGAARRWIAVPNAKTIITEYPLNAYQLRSFKLL